jgi:hypothetical protein
MVACRVGDHVQGVGWLTFVLEEVAHASSTGEDQLGDILDDLCLVLGRECSEPLGQALRRESVYVHYMQTAGRHTTLPWRERRMRYLRSAVSQRR